MYFVQNLQIFVLGYFQCYTNLPLASVSLDISFHGEEILLYWKEKYFSNIMHILDFGGGSTHAG